MGKIIERQFETKENIDCNMGLPIKISNNKLKRNILKKAKEINKSLDNLKK